MIPDFLKKLLGKGGDAAATAPKPGLESLSAPLDVGITPKPTIASPLSPSYANPMDTMAATPAPTPAIPSIVNDPRMAGKTIQDEFKLRQSDPNQEVVFREPFGAEKYDYVTHGGTELPHRSWKEALKNIGTGALLGMANGGGLGGAIGGAVTGGVTGAIDPTIGKSLRFNSFQLPKLAQNRELQNEQALNQAKIGGITAQAERDRLLNADGNVIDTRTGQVVFQKPEPGFNLPQGAIRVQGGKTIASNPVVPKIAAASPHYVRDASGNYVDLNAPENKGKAIQGYDKPVKEPSAELSPYQKAQMERQERTDAAKMAMEVEKLKTAANQAFNSTDPEEKKMFSTLLGQHSAAARDLAQTYPDYYDVQFDDNGWAAIKATGAGRRDVKNVPVKGGSKIGGHSISRTTAMDLLNR